MNGESTVADIKTTEESSETPDKLIMAFKKLLAVTTLQYEGNLPIEETIAWNDFH